MHGTNTSTGARSRTDRRSDAAQIGLSALCYRSQATPGLDVADILALVEVAQSRNAELGITGVLFYDHGRFLQWLEGPAPALEDVLAAISQDQRHNGIEVLSNEPLAARRYSDWHMQLSCGEDDADLLALVDREHVVVLSEALLPTDDAPLSTAQAETLGGFLADTCRAMHEPLDQLLPATTVRPVPVARVALRAAPLRRVNRETLQETARALTGLLLQSDPFARVSEIEDLCRSYGPLPTDFGRLYEAITETVSEALTSDRLTKAQATLASAALQMVLRRIHHLPDPQHGRGDVMVSSAPGEPQFLEATISGEILREAGWSTSVVYPDSDGMLIDRLRRTAPPTLVLAASQLDQHDTDDRMIGLISALRAEPDLPALKIIVGGRIARMPQDQIAVIGADAAFEHILDLAEAVSRTASTELRNVTPQRGAPLPGRDSLKRNVTSGFLLANVLPRVLHRMNERRHSDS